MESTVEAVRVLVVDDEAAILALMGEILSSVRPPLDEASTLSARLFGADAPQPPTATYRVTACRQGEEAVETVREAGEDDPFAIAFLDVRMPPGINGVETAERIRALDPHVEIVIVTAYSDVDPAEIARRVPPPQRLLYLNKPFHPYEIRQLAAALSHKWRTERDLRGLLTELDDAVDEWFSVLTEDPLDATIRDQDLIDEAADELARLISMPGARRGPITSMVATLSGLKRYARDQGATRAAKLLKGVERAIVAGQEDPDHPERRRSVARFRGDRLWALLPGVSEDASEDALRPVRAAVDAHEGLRLVLGLATWTPEGGESPDSVVRRALHALASERAEDDDPEDGSESPVIS